MMFPLFPLKPCSGSNRNLMARVPEGRRRSPLLFRLAGIEAEKRNRVDGYVNITSGERDRRRSRAAASWKLALRRTLLAMAVTMILVMEMVPSALALTFNGFQTPTGQSNPTVITAGPDGNLWFTETSANKIGRITPGGMITKFPLPTAVGLPSGI